MAVQTCAPQISAGVDGGPSGGLCVRRPGSEDPHQYLQKLLLLFIGRTQAGINCYMKNCLVINNHPHHTVYSLLDSIDYCHSDADLVSQSLGFENRKLVLPGLHLKGGVVMHVHFFLVQKNRQYNHHAYFQ